MDFIEYIVSEMKSKRLSKANALELLRQASFGSGRADRSTFIHPLLHRNTSDIYQQCYCSSFGGDEFFLDDHRVVTGAAEAVRVLPGVAYLEMARAAVADAIPELPDSNLIELNQVVWLQPLFVTGPQDVFIRLSADVSDRDGRLEIEFEVVSTEEDSSGEPEVVVHCRGLATVTERGTSPRIDVAALQARMQAGSLDASAVYAAYQRMGMNFGPGHRSVGHVFKGTREAVARLTLPECVRNTRDVFELHPSLLDGALQSAIGLLTDLHQLPSQPSVPFALDGLRVLSSCKQEMYAWIRHAADTYNDSPHQDNVVKLDIDLCDADGNVCVALRGFSSRTLGAGGLNAPQRSAGEALGVVLGSPVWKQVEIQTRRPPGEERHLVVLCNIPGMAGELLGKELPNCVCHVATAQPGGIAQRFTETALRCFEIVRERLLDESAGNACIQIVIAEEPDSEVMIGLSGLLKSAALECPAIRGQLLLVPAGMTAAALAARLRDETRQTRDTIVRYRDGVREVPGWQELPSQRETPKVAFKEGGVYLITGGLGGLGTLFAKEILQQTRHARIVLTGRREPSPDIDEKLRALAASDTIEPRIEYRMLDVSDLDQAQRLVADINTRYGQLNGVIHSAGMIADNLIARKTPEEFAQVLAPKVFGAANLELATRASQLDFLALFSSGASIMGNVGQADYAVANGFLDQFAAQADAPERKGRLLSINWPLWQEGGMQIPAGVQDAMRERTGMQAMRTRTGISAFYRIVASPQPRAVVIEGEVEKIRRALFDDLRAAEEERTRSEAAVTLRDAPALPDLPAQATSADNLSERTQEYLRKQFAVLFKLPYNKVDPRAPLEKYGIDSILAMDLTRQLEKSFGPLSKTLMFEYRSIDELADYFLRSHASKLDALFKLAEQPQPEASPASAAARPDRKVSARSRLQRQRTSAVGSPRDNRPHDEPIAIVGLSGRYPAAADIHAFWNNLRDGKDCITEIPADRWNWRDYYNEDRTAEGCHYSKWGGFIEGVDEFDPLFFNLPPVDAEFLDPQERLFLQHAWMAIEDAGYTRASLQIPHATAPAGQVAVYVGVMYGEYQLFGAEASLQGKRMGVPVSYASIANRVSYILNLRGPSMTVDSMCSSSLTAIHLACQDLKLGRASLAIAGGVNVSVHPNKYFILSSGQYISSDGRCQSFGIGGDGYIPSEGVGVVVLKRLSDAQRDGNHIYGLIRGCALNHGGKTNGYSVPNPQAQASVIGQALQESGVDARHVSYIEAHGTGTKLGDPIEIAALTQAFRRYTQENQFCALGSVKSNIGHCESAAGIAALTKVLLQMKHQLIVPSLHSQTLNPYIEFDSSPFVVNQALRKWEEMRVDGTKLPRIAGISSFGAGGSNAHLIVEEYPGPQRAPAFREIDASGPQVVIPLSARTAEQLKQRARDLLAFIETRERAIDLAPMAYTLQVGREAMGVRLAILADSAPQLAEKLASWISGETSIDQCFHGEAEHGAEDMSVLNLDDDMREAIDKWIRRRKLPKLAELWVRGLDIDWRKLYGERTPGLISLPTYPFARDRYWIARDRAGILASASTAAVLHPLAHTNTSDFLQQSYATHFRGDELFLADHQIASDGDARHRVLPAVAYLEMARAAVDLALPADAERGALELRNIAWVQPLRVDRETRVCIALSLSGESDIDFEVLGPGEAREQDAVHCQGQVTLTTGSQSSKLQIEALEARMSRGELAPSHIYGVFKAMGIHYGRAFQSIVAVQQGQDELLAELTLPNAWTGANDYVLHPSLLDGAFQASIGLVADVAGLPKHPFVPFALDSLTLVAACAPRMLAWVRYAKSGGGEKGITKIDIDLCDPDGNVCVTLRGLMLRALGAQAGARQIPHNPIGGLLAQPAWEARQYPCAVASPVQKIRFERHDLVLCDLPNLDLKRLAALIPGVELTRLPSAETESIAERYSAAALTCFERLQAILRNRPQEKVLFQLAMAKEGQSALLGGLSGLIRTARLECPNLIGQVILTDQTVDEATLAGQLQASQVEPDESLFKYEGTTQSVPRWRADPLQNHRSAAFENCGVYLITGGLGGLGLVFAREILERAPGARVILTGRSELSAEISVRLANLCAQLAVAPEQLSYRPLDLTRLDRVEALIAQTLQQFGRLDGVLHSAGMIRDGFIINKTLEDFAAVLAPKVSGTVNLDLATQAIDLDFMVLFSSVAAPMGNVGQADYAAANGFMDEYAAYRNRLVSAGRRHGQTLAINWPLWEEGGMRIDQQTQELLLGSAGVVPLKSATGLQAFHRSLELRSGQTLVLEGHVERLQRLLRNDRAPDAKQSASPAPLPVAAGTLLEKTQAYLSGLLANLLKAPAHEIDPKAPLETYGIDSVLAMKLTQQLEQTFGSLSKTLFFEYQTIASLAGYLVKAFPAIVEQKTGVQQKAGAAAGAAHAQVREPGGSSGDGLPIRHRVRPRNRGKARFVAPAIHDAGDIAIIGVSGRYPLADNVHELWENLKTGRDCITEIPPERWDHSRYFHCERDQPGKSYSKWGGFIAGVDRFDPLFFNISPKEAELIDPQERLFLETVWETIEDAAYDKDSIARSRVGVFVGVMWGQYELLGAASPQAGVPSSSFASIANRVSYFFNFQGPSLAIDTMCSSSLTAIHLACEEIRKGAVDVAIAGGVNVSIHPSKYLSLSQGNFASSDGRCRSFGQGGDGYVPGEGVGAILLKPLAKALADGDHVYAVVKASSINHGGKTNGYTVPNPIAQSAVILETLKKAAIDPATIGYLESHGTGTALGDPIEINGLVRAFEAALAHEPSQAKLSCPIGSVKSNIGHLESAAGIAAVTKVLLQLKHRQLVPSLHAEPPSSHIDWQTSPFHVQTQLADWKSPDNQPRRAGISSFGAGGSNAHIILQEHIDSAVSSEHEERPEAFVLSSKRRDGLLAYAQKMVRFLDHASNLPLRDIAYTSQIGRTPMQERLVVIASNHRTLRDKLERWLRQSRDHDEQAQRGPVHEIEGVYEGSLKRAQAGAAALIEGEAGEAYLGLLLEGRELSKLARLWISGVQIDWARLYRSEGAKRVSLPTYSFTRQRYWLDGADPAPRASSREVLYYRPEWRPVGLMPATSAQQTRRLLLVLDADDALFEELKQQRSADALVLVKPGAGYRQLAADVFSVDPSSEADFLQLIESLTANSLYPLRIVQHCRADGDIEQQLDQSIFALHHVCKAVMRQKPKDTVRIVSAHVEESAAYAALHGALAGYLKTLALENPKFLGKTIAVQGRISTADLAQRLSAELEDEDWRHKEIRYLSDRQRHVRDIARYFPSESPAAHAGIKQGGVYLITGGLGGLGYIFSEHLARNYGSKLVLMGRSAPDGAQQARLTTLKSLTRDVIYLQADVSSREQVRDAVREAKRQFSRLDGVIHAAGAHLDSFILNKSRDEMKAVLAAKVMGTSNLDWATQDEDLDLFVLFSSVAGVLGNPGQSDYAFANSYLDAFAERRAALLQSRQRSGRTLSISWPFWAAGGMRLSESDIALAEQRSGVCPLPTEKGIQCCEQLLRSDASQSIALYGIASKIDAYVLPAKVGKATTAERATLDSRTLAEQTESYLKSLLSEQIKLAAERIDAQSRFESFGVDSMMINRMNAHLERDLGELPRTLFYEYATITELAAYLMQEAGPRLAQLLGVAARAPSDASESIRATAIATAIERPLRADPAPIAATERIAIIGMHAHFPQSEDLAHFWENLSRGKDLIVRVPEDRWNARELHDADAQTAKEGKIYCEWGGFLNDIDKFDAAFFGIPAEDARMMDPQERLFLQSVWAAIEDAGYTREGLRTRFPRGKSASVGVFAGVTTNSYHLHGPEEWSRGNPVTPGSLPWSIANRVSYYFDFQGPSMPVDTACSSSLVAIHLACESLKRMECQVAIAGGVNLYLHPAKYQSLCRRRMLARGGKCRSFGTGDDGFIPGEGVGTVVLKPLSRAIADRDHIYGIIAASACEHSGRSNGYSAPNPHSQAQLIEETLRKADIPAESISYIEGHGTGTQLGDSLEIAALTQAFRRQTPKTQFCPIGSVKANVGHAESAAGMAGVAKILLQLEHRQIAPSLHSDPVNPNIDFERSPFYLQRELSSWSAPQGWPRRAMINSFGAGGVNACVILEEGALAQDSAGAAPNRPRLIVLSAKNAERLRESAGRLGAYLRNEGDIDLGRLAYTLQIGREAMDERLAIVVASKEELLNELSSFESGAVSANAVHRRVELRGTRKSATAADRERAQRAYRSSDLRTLAELWVGGQEIDWDGFYEDDRPIKLSVPTYPFAKERYWVSDSRAPDSGTASKQPLATLHPLVSRNVSTLKEVAFASVLSCEQYYARDHRIKGEKYFPGSGFLEIACISGAIAAELSVSSIRDIVWAQPLKLSSGNPVVTTLLSSSGDSTDYVMVSFNEDQERVVHCEGRLVHGAGRKHGDGAESAVSIRQLQEQCAKSVQGTRCYRDFQRFGFQYGPCFQTIQELHIGQQFALSKLRLAEALMSDLDQYILHPCLIDGALQTVIGLAGESEPDASYVPFALDEIEILQPLPRVCYAYAQLSTPAHRIHSDIRQFNIRLLNESGQVLVKLNNFYVRALSDVKATLKELT